mgnify:CR=1 FL=1
MEDEFDVALKSLGNMYDDEIRAREQLEEIQEFLKTCNLLQYQLLYLMSL